MLAPLFDIPAISQPFEQRITDCVDPLPLSRSRTTYLPTIMYLATHYPTAYPFVHDNSQVCWLHVDPVHFTFQYCRSNSVWPRLKFHFSLVFSGAAAATCQAQQSICQPQEETGSFRALPQVPVACLLQWDWKRLEGLTWIMSIGFGAGSESYWGKN